MKKFALALMTAGTLATPVAFAANLPAVPPEQMRSGPKLTGMGKHHPPAYFLESIVNPSAVKTSAAPSKIAAGVSHRHDQAPSLAGSAE